MTLEIISHILFVVAMLSNFSYILMTFYLGKIKIKKIDRLVYGCEIASDSIFFQLIRLPKYGGAFSSHWVAKRSHLLEIRDHFDKKFQRPFIIAHHLLLTGGISMVLLFLLDKFLLNIT